MPPVSQRRSRLKFYALVLGIVFVLTFFMPFFARPQTAQAFPGEALAAQVWRYVKDRIDKAITVARKNAADLAFKNALKVYLTKFAEDTAIWIASAGTGQKPLYRTDPHYWTNLTDAAAGDFLDTLATNTFGVNVCAPADLRTQFSIESAVRALVDPENFCSNQCRSNLNDALSTDTFLVGEGIFSPVTTNLPTAEQFLNGMNSIAGQCDLNLLASAVDLGGSPEGWTRCGFFASGIQLGDTTCPDDGLTTPATCIAAYTSAIATYKRTANQDYSLCLNLCSAKKRVARCTFTQIQANIENLGGQIKNADFLPKITRYFEPGENDIGQILTLVEQAKQTAQQAKEEEQSKQDTKILPVTDPITGEVITPSNLTTAAAEKGLTEDPSGSIFGIYTGSPVADAIGVFTNTLTKRLLKRIYSRDGGFNPGTSPQNAFSEATGSSGIGGAQAARALFASIAEPDFTPGGSSVSLAELVACPDQSPGPNNCVIDEGFRQAIEQQMTVQEAIDANLLNPNLPVGFKFVQSPGGIGTNVEPNYREGYPYRSLLILRRLRILPIGWELAAQYMRDNDSPGSTRDERNLGSLVDQFNQCGQGGTTPKPFCGLIDPSWVLKAPELLCRISGPTEALTSDDYVPNALFPDAPEVRQIGRSEQCADEQSCLQEDEDGNCLAFGYCLEERAAWKFGGDQCTSAYHSCETFTDPQAIEASFLTNNLDYEGCTASNAGCRWYCSAYNATTGSYDCTASTGQKDYYTAKVSSCPDNAVGCTEYVRTTNTSNLLANGGFEILPPGAVADDGASDSFQGWQSTGVITEAASEANNGATSARATGNPGEELRNIFDTKFPLNGQSTTLTFYARAADPSCSGAFGMRTSAGGNPYFQTQPVTFSQNWQRYATTLTYDPTLSFDSSVITAFVELNGCAAFLDDVQMEFGTTFSSYKDYGSINKIYLNGERASCRPEEVGCDLYSSSTNQIPGVVTSADFCPQDAVGCRAFLEVPVADNGADPSYPVRTGKRCSQDQSLSCTTNADCSGAGSCLPSVSLIPKTGSTCSAAYVGCEEYTNLDEVARGGEGKENYTYIRECVKPNGNANNEQTYYTWVGSEETGFELKAYLLKPTSALIGDDATGGGPDYVAGTDASLCSEVIYNAGDTPDCRKFYDAGLNVYYRLYSKTITVSVDCHPLRNTVDGQIYNAIPSEGTLCPASAVQCREYRGSSGFNTRTILSDAFDDGDTLGWDGGSWSTESLSFGGGSALAGGTFQSNATLDVPTQLEQGRSYIVSFWAGAGNAGSDNATITARFGSSPLTEFFEGNATIKWDAAISNPLWNFYTLGPLHLDRAPDANDHLQFAINGGSSYFIDNIKLFEVADNLYLIKGSYDLCAGNENCDAYRNRESDQFYLKSFTRLCSQDVLGCEALINTANSDSPFGEQFANGTNRDGSEPKTVSSDGVELIVNNPQNYCREEEQGCSRYGSPKAFSCSNNRSQVCGQDSDCGPGNTCTAQYDTVFLNDDPDTYATTLCRSAEVMCDAWKSSINGETRFFKHPDPYTCDYRTVTISGVAFTGWYKTGTSGLNPGDACPVRNPAPQAQLPIVPTIPYTQPKGVCVSNSAISCSVDADCASYGGQCVKWVGMCPKEESGCKEYRDPTDPAVCRPECLLTFDQGGTPIPVNASCAIDQSSAKTGCRGYWYLRQTVEDDATECNGTVNDDIGCRKFYSPDPL